VTCHRGLENPATLDQVILKTAGANGVAAAVAKYRELRSRYYGTGSYDFGPGSLGKAAQSLAQEKGDMDGALALLDLNLEMNPEDSGAHLMKAQVLLAKGDKAGARASAKRAADLDPENGQAAEMLDQLK
jgi:Tfp pilus assembly protein PilF